MENRRGRHSGYRLFLFALECGCNKHSHLHHSWIRDHDTDLAGADTGIEDWKNIVDPALEYAAWISIESDLRRVAGLNVGQIIFVYVTDDSHGREIGDGEGTRPQALHAARIGYLLIGDNAGDWCGDIDHA